MARPGAESTTILECFVKVFGALQCFVSFRVCNFGIFLSITVFREFQGWELWMLLRITVCRDVQDTKHCITTKGSSLQSSRNKRARRNLILLHTEDCKNSFAFCSDYRTTEAWWAPSDEKGVFNSRWCCLMSWNIYRSLCHGCFWKNCHKGWYNIKRYSLEYPRNTLQILSADKKDCLPGCFWILSKHL